MADRRFEYNDVSRFDYDVTLDLARQTMDLFHAIADEMNRDYPYPTTRCDCTRDRVYAAIDFFIRNPGASGPAMAIVRDAKQHRCQNCLAEEARRDPSPQVSVARTNPVQPGAPLPL